MSNQLRANLTSLETHCFLRQLKTTMRGFFSIKSSWSQLVNYSNKVCIIYGDSHLLPELDEEGTFEHFSRCEEEIYQFELLQNTFATFFAKNISSRKLTDSQFRHFSLQSINWILMNNKFLVRCERISTFLTISFYLFQVSLISKFSLWRWSEIRGGFRS